MHMVQHRSTCQCDIPTRARPQRPREGWTSMAASGPGSLKGCQCKASASASQGVEGAVLGPCGMFSKGPAVEHVTRLCGLARMRWALAILVSTLLGPQTRRY